MVDALLSFVFVYGFCRVHHGVDSRVDVAGDVFGMHYLQAVAVPAHFGLIRMVP